MYQLFRKRGDILVFRCDDQKKVTVCLDGYDQSPTHDKARFTPRCVGADCHVTKWGWNNLNATFLQNRQHQTGWCLILSSLTEEEREDVIHNRYKVPLFANRGKAIGKSSAGFEEIREFHRVVALPFAA